jgi:3-hydroxyisobutyrate dehydrogenase
MATIGFIGLGNMGAPMAANLVKAQHRVTGYDIVAAPVAALAERGGHAAASAVEAAAAGDIVITMLPAGPQVRSVYLGPDGIIARAKKGALLIDCSTIDVETARLVAATAAEAGFEMLDAPVSGGTIGAEAGTLTFMVGGPASAFARAEPILKAMGRTIVHAGPAGNGQSAKICNNMMLAVSMIGVCEGFALAEKLGLSAQTLLEIDQPELGDDRLLPGAGAGAGGAVEPRLCPRLHRRDDAEGSAPGPGRRGTDRLGRHARRRRRQSLPALCRCRKRRARLFRHHAPGARLRTRGMTTKI